MMKCGAVQYTAVLFSAYQTWLSSSSDLRINLVESKIRHSKIERKVRSQKAVSLMRAMPVGVNTTVDYGYSEKDSVEDEGKQ